MIETADNDFFGNVEEETQRRLKEMENEEKLATTSIKIENSQEHIGENETKPDEDEKQINGIDLQKSVDDIKKEADKELLEDQ